MKYINQFFWWCAGANLRILKKCPTDHAKYFGLGGTILFTAMMATFAGGYAFYTAFDDILLSCLFGGFWGAMIFNLDRFIVSSTGKGDGTIKITKEEWQNALPRIILAVIIGFVIAVPLELKVFEKEINVEINKIINEERKTIKGGLVDIKDEIQRLKDRKVELDEEFEKIEATLKDGGDVIVSKASGSITSLKQLKASQEGSYNEAKSKYHAGRSRYYRYKKKLEEVEEGLLLVDDKTKKEYERKKYDGRKNRNKYEPIMNKWKKELDETDAELLTLGVELDERESVLKEDFKTFQEKIKIEKNRVDKDLVELEQLLKTKEKEADDTSIQFDGFMAQLIAMDRLSIKKDTVYRYANIAPSIDNTAESTLSASPVMEKQVLKVNKTKTPVWYAKWMISILLICIEIAPILFKMMTESGPYDDRLEEIRYESEIAKKKKMSDINEKINLELKLNNELHNNKIAAEVAANKELLASIAQAQAEIAQQAIETWKKEQIQKVAANPSLVVQSSQMNGNGKYNL